MRVFLQRTLRAGSLSVCTEAASGLCVPHLTMSSTRLIHLLGHLWLLALMAASGTLQYTSTLLCLNWRGPTTAMCVVCTELRLCAVQVQHLELELESMEETGEHQGEATTMMAM